jgi:AcrR family transcriptional regulator
MAAAESPETEGFTAKGRATRERILRSAADVLLSEGLSGFNLERVRGAADVSGSQLSHYFADKPALIRAVLDRQIDLVLDFHRQPKLGGLLTFDDFERWADLNLRYLRSIDYAKTPTYHSLAGQLAKSDDATRRTLGDGYRRWVDLLEQSFQRMKDRGVLVTSVDPRALALVVVCGHQGAGTLGFAYREDWPLADASRFIVNYLRTFAADPNERVARRARRARRRRTRDVGDGDDNGDARLTQKGLVTRGRIVSRAAELMFQRGVNGTSLDDVRKAVNVSGSQLSHYFADKRDLTRKVIASRANEVIEFHTQPELGHLDSLAALRSWAQACVANSEAVYLRGGCIYGSLAGELLESDDEILDDLCAGYDDWVDLFGDGLSAMRRRGDLTSEADPRHLAVAVVVAHQGGAMLTHAMETVEPLEALVTAPVDYVSSFRPAPRKRASRSRSRPSNKR